MYVLAVAILSTAVRMIGDEQPSHRVLSRAGRRVG
jgi:hypothetical protein